MRCLGNRVRLKLRIVDEFEYHQESDMLYIRLHAGTSSDSEEVAPGVVLDYDRENQVVGIEIEDASHKMDLTRLEVSAVAL